MNNLNKVELQFKYKALVRGGILLFTKEDALLFIKECEMQGVGILGIDGFFITAYTQSSMDNSVDYSKEYEQVNRI